MNWNLITLTNGLFPQQNPSRRMGLWQYVGGTSGRRSLCLFWREAKQRPELVISNETGSGEGKAGPREARKGQLAKGTQRGWVGEGRRREAVDNGQQKEAVRKTVKDELAFLVAFVGFSRKIYARDSLQNARKAIQKRVTKLPFLRLELTQVHIVRLLFFFSHSLGCISCGRKEMCDTPVGTNWMNHKPWIVLVLRSWCIRGGRRGVSQDAQ